MNVSDRKIMFEVVVGYENEKQELLEIKKYLSQTEQFEVMGARAPKGILIFGPNGVGKTLMVKALSNEIGVPLYSVGDSEDDNQVRYNLRETFKKARNTAPSIILIDEIDKYNREPSIGMYPEINYTDQSIILRELVTLMDGFTPNEGVIVIATSNTKIGLDQSLLRSGRFDRFVQMNFPNLEDREALFRHYSKNKKISKEINYGELASKSTTLSGADIDNILNDAVLIGMRKGLIEVTMNEIEESLDRVSMKSATKNTMSKQQKYETAIHEAGHAVVIIATDNKSVLNKISIESRGNAYGFTRTHSDIQNLQYSTTKDNLLAKIRSLLGGYVAEELKLGSTTAGASDDLQKILMICETMVKEYGMFGLDKITEAGGRNTISEQKRYRIENAIYDIIEKEYETTKQILQKQEKLFEEIIQRLIEQEVIFKDEIIEIANKYYVK